MEFFVRKFLFKKKIGRSPDLLQRLEFAVFPLGLPRLLFELPFFFFFLLSSASKKKKCT